MQNRPLQADAFDSSSPEQYHLLVELGDNELLYTLVHIPTNTCQFVSFRFCFSHIEELENQIEADELLKKNWKHISINVVSEKYLLVPAAILNDRDLVENTFRLQFSLPTGEMVDKALLTSEKVGLLYSVSPQIKLVIDKYYDKAFVKHQAEVFMGNILKNDYENNGTKAYILFKNNALNMVLCENGEIVFCNSFKYAASEDALYYILNVIQHFELKTDELDLEIAGYISEDSGLLKMFSRFFSKFSFIKPDNKKVSFPFSENIEHELVNLLNLYPCE
jgi:hypothetical protein